MASSGEEDLAGHETFYTCKRCPGEVFSLAQKEDHRQKHRNERAAAQAQQHSSKRPGPASKTRGGVKKTPTAPTRKSARGTSPIASTESLFSVQVAPQNPRSAGKRKHVAKRTYQQNIMPKQKFISG